MTTKITKPIPLILHVLVIVSNLYYSTIVAGIVFDNMKWGPEILRGLPLFFLMTVSWLFFHRFQVLLYSYIAFVCFTFLIIFFIFYSSFSLGRHVFFHIPLDKYENDPEITFPKMLYGLAEEWNRSLYLYSPYFIYAYFLFRGLRRKCPKCNFVDGLYNRKIIKKELTGTSNHTVMETTETRTPIFYGSHEGGIRVERKTRPVEYQTNHYHVDCVCKVCGHEWTFRKSYSSKKN